MPNAPAAAVRPDASGSSLSADDRRALLRCMMLSREVERRCCELNPRWFPAEGEEAAHRGGLLRSAGGRRHRGALPRPVHRLLHARGGPGPAGRAGAGQGERRTPGGGPWASPARCSRTPSPGSPETWGRAWAWPPGRRWGCSTEGPTGWWCAPSATGRATGATSTRRSIWPRCGSCRGVRLPAQPVLHLPARLPGHRRGQRRGAGRGVRDAGRGRRRERRLRRADAVGPGGRAGPAPGRGRP